MEEYSRLAKLFGKGFLQDLGVLFKMLDDRNLSIEGMRPYTIIKPLPIIPCPDCGRPLRTQNCCAKPDRLVCICGYREPV